MLSLLQTRVEQHPEELLTVFEELLTTYERAKTLRHSDPKVALHTLDSIMHKVHTLQRLPLKIVPLSHEMWSTHLARIYNCCHKERDAIHQAHHKWSQMETADQNDTHSSTDDTVDHTLHPWISDWTNDTLQSKAVKQMVKAIAIPILFPHTFYTTHNNLSAQSRTLVVEGPANTGKSYALNAIRRYVDTHKHTLPQLDVKWVSLTAYDCPTVAQQRLDEQRQQRTHTEPTNPHQWTVYITDRVSHKDVHDWSTSTWCGAWERMIRTSKSTMWIVLVTSSKPLSESYHTLFPHRIAMPRPNHRTVYHYLKQCIFKHYRTTPTATAHKTTHPPTAAFPAFARLPVVDHLANLAHFVDTFVSHHHPDFAMLGKLFEGAVSWSAECGLRENCVFGVADENATLPNHIEWYPKNSVIQTKLPTDHRFKLLKHSKHDSIEWCPQTTNRDHSKCTAETATFWNTHLFDTLPSCEYDRFTQLYIDPKSIGSEEDTPRYSLIAVFPLEANIFPYHLHGCLQGCYEWAVAFGYATAQHLLPSSTADPCTTTMDVLSYSDKQCSEVYGSVLKPYIQYQNVVCSAQVWYFEQNPVRKSNSNQATRIHISYGNQRSSSLAEYVNGVNNDVSAETLQQILTVLINRADVPCTCHVVQVQTHRGYAYYIDFLVQLERSFTLECTGDEGMVQICPRVQLPVLQSGWLLDKHFHLCTESDVDALIDKFPQEYKDIYRDEEATWKLKPIRKPAHLAHLNTKYTNEQRCYLKLFCDLLRVKESHYACLSPTLRNQLDDALTDLQAHLDYLLQIIPENDHEGKWNEVWSMSETHPLHDAYHLPKHNEVDKVIGVNLATEWLRRDASFWVSPRWLSVLMAVGEAMEGHYTGKPTHTPLTQMVHTWKVFCKCDVQRTTQWVYLKSSVSHCMWKEAQACGKLYECAYQKMSSKHIQTDGTLRMYRERVAKHSLFHTLFDRASHIGVHHTSTNCIRWMTFGGEGSAHTMQTDPLASTLMELRKEPMLWSLVCANTMKVHHPWLFALQQLSGTFSPAKASTDHMTYKQMYAHLLFSPKLAYWSLEAFDAKDKDVLVDIQRQPFLDRFVRQYAYIHKQMHRKPLELHGALPGQYVRTAVHDTLSVSAAPQVSKQEKQVMQPAELNRLRLYGLDVHHLEDIAACIGRMDTDTSSPFAPFAHDE